jgi:hypothetical protein
MPGTVDSYNAKLKYASAREATGGLKPGVCWVSNSAKDIHSVATAEL